MNEQREFGLAAVLGITVSKLLEENGFSAMHECAEFVMGYPIWTHEFASQVLWEDMRENVLRQHPKLALAGDAGEVSDPETARAFMDKWTPVFGETLVLTKGDGERGASPLETFREMAPDKPVIVLEES